MTEKRRKKMPAVSAKQYGFMQARANNQPNKAITGGAGPTVSVAKEFVAKTPAKKRKKFAQILANNRGLNNAS